MSGSFVLLLVTLAFVVYGTVTALKSEAPKAARALAVLVYAALGVHTILLAWWYGDGRVLPGLQLSPEFRNYYAGRVRAGSWPALQPAVGIVALLAHLAVAIPRPGRGALLALLPVTLFFGWTFFHFQGKEDGRATTYERVLGPGEHAYLTVAPDGKGVRLIFSIAGAADTFARVLHVHAADAKPPEPTLFWTKDGKAVVLASRRRRIFAVDRDGETTGTLPVASHEWPAADPALESVAVQRVLSAAARDVDHFVRAHGGIYVR